MSVSEEVFDQEAPIWCSITIRAMRWNNKKIANCAATMRLTDSPLGGILTTEHIITGHPWNVGKFLGLLSHQGVSYEMI